MSDSHDGAGRRRRAPKRRRFLQAAGALSVSSLAGCLDVLGGDDEQRFEPGQIGSGRGGDYTPAGTPMEAMPDLSGEITVFSGRGEPLVAALFDYMDDLYPDLTITPRYDGSTALVNRIQSEGENSAADVFFSVNAGSLGQLADAGRAGELPSEVVDLPEEEFTDPDGMWVGTSGRARTVPYNTDTFGEGDVPNDIFAFPDAEQFDGVMGWAPSYGSFQAFVTAMRILNGEEETRAWLEGMLESGVQEYGDEFTIAQRIADGEIQAGFTNHYYIQRVLDSRPDAPLATAFTENDAGSVFNVAGACTVDTAADPEMAANFVRHLLSAEAQEYFIAETFEYPVIPEAEPIGDLPPVEDLQPPQDLDLSQLADIQPTLELLREVGITV
ncbi:extracellular solute-binding protein [Halomarina oriensis]|uniref:Extracellular solute-binding protein n=1 Tax=Halomarina oriensis TaxID=671145 RepID=A0A6B0GPR5_9EURY|nr:extracellular solute-binding protein [Halomarina oriensis]MWG33628.1 extracellular solute-binding protein [Halomarina oriensis]